jgi:hypothetical protein
LLDVISGLCSETIDTTFGGVVCVGVASTSSLEFPLSAPALEAEAAKLDCGAGF